MSRNCIKFPVLTATFLPMTIVLSVQLTRLQLVPKKLLVVVTLSIKQLRVMLAKITHVR